MCYWLRRFSRIRWPKIIKSADSQMRKYWEFGKVLLWWTHLWKRLSEISLFIVEIIWAFSNDNDFIVDWTCPSVNISVFLNAPRVEFGLNPVLLDSKTLWFLFDIISWNSLLVGRISLCRFPGPILTKMVIFSSARSSLRIHFSSLVLHLS